MSNKVLASHGCWELEDKDEDGDYYIFNMDLDQGQFVSSNDLIDLRILLEKFFDDLDFATGL